MKLRFILNTIIFVFFVNEISAQCDHDVNTNPDNPSNNNAPDQRYLNEFNWWEGEQLHNGGYTLSNMYYNYPNDPYGPMGNIQDVNQSSYYQYLVKNFAHIEEMNPQNGWELLLVNLGRYPDDDTEIIGNTLEDAPYIVLYHRYKNLIRVFVKHGINEGISNAVDGIKINLYYADQADYSGILRTGNPIDQSLSNETDVLHQTAIASSNGNPNKFWMSADFTVAFDPCVCSYLSILKLDFEQFQETELSLNGRAVSTQESLVSAQGSVIENDFLGSMEYVSYIDQNTDEITSEVNQGYITYRLIGDLYDDYIAKMEAYKLAVGYNEGVDKQLKWVKLSKQFINLAITAFTGTNGVGLSSGDQDLLQQTFDQFPETDFTTGTDEEKEEKYNNWWERAYMAIADGYDFLINENIPTMSEINPTMPTVGVTEMTFSGSMLQTKEINGPRFYTPGSYSEENEIEKPTMYPVYDQPLGVFALLENPKIDIYKSGIPGRTICEDNPDEECEDYVVEYGGSTSGTITYEQVCTDISKEHYVQMKLAEPLKYSFNNSLEIEDYHIEASFQIKSKINSPNLMPHDNSIDPNFYKSPDYEVSNNSDLNANVESLDFDIENDVNLGIGDTYTLKSSYVPLENFLDFPIQFSTKENRTYYRPVSDPSFGHDCQDLANAQSGQYHDDYFQFDDLEVELKLIITVKFEGQNEDGSDREYKYLRTYKINQNDINELSSPEYSYLFVEEGAPQGMSQNLYLNSPIFSGGQVDGCDKLGNQYFCRAWNDIVIEGDVHVSNPFEVMVYAGNEIKVIGESTIPDEMILEIFPEFDFSQPVNEVETENITEYCNNNVYQANRPTNKNINSGIDDGESKKIKNEFNVKLYPNPTSDLTYLEYTSSEDGLINVQVKDMKGRIVKIIESNSQIQKGKSRNQINTSHFDQGVYLVCIEINGVTKTLKLVKH
ncbi:MAG: T9SS type A sorting domain-containing protein [Brumimicrobium sp.]